MFLSRCEYQNAFQWAEAVRPCEALTIVGWGRREQVDAVCEKCENGWHTMFLDALGDNRYLYSGWTKPKAGFALHNPQYIEFIASHLLLAVDHAASCLRKCGVGYDMVRFRRDVERGLEHWSENCE